MKTVEDVMTTEVVTCEPDEEVSVVARRLRENDVSGAPVVKEGEVVGVVSEADLLDLLDTKQEDANIWLPSPFEAFELPLRAFPWREWAEKHGLLKETLHDIGATQVRDVMNKSPRVVAPTKPLDEAAGVMVRTGYNRLPVVDDGALVGIMTRGDALDGMSGGEGGEEGARQRSQ
ncbi:MAG: CBS domain-containing protein [Halobacteriales archaeon]